MPRDMVNHPSHYTFGAVEVIDAIEAWQLGFHLGNVVKYVARSGHKNDELEDLKKARWYLDRRIQKLQEDRDKQTAVERECSEINVKAELNQPTPETAA